MKPILLKKPPKKERGKKILLGVVEVYLKTGKPIGSNTLKENGFNDLSSATIRNYFAELEEEGFLKQQHSSGGRIPTDLAYRYYVDAFLHQPLIDQKTDKILKDHLLKETRGVATYLQNAAELLSELTCCAVFLSAPRFDQDFVLDIKLISIDEKRILCVLMTDFGLIHTEVLHLPRKCPQAYLKRIEAFFHWRMTGLDKPILTEQEETLAQNLYQEVMLRHIVNYTHFHKDDIYRTGFSKLLNYPDFNDAAALAKGLSLFENTAQMKTLLQECCEKKSLSCLIGSSNESELIPSGCALISIPYQINHSVVGSAAILGPSRLSYRELFGTLTKFGEYLSQTLTKSMYKFKISYRQPAPQEIKAHCLLLENKRKMK